jgi:ketosteroid isomerase-like protein
VDFFNKGDFAGVASLYTKDATAFPPGAGMMKGRAAIEAMWKGAAEQVGDPKFITLEVKPLGPSAAQEIGTFSLKGASNNDVFARDCAPVRFASDFQR